MRFVRAHHLLLVLSVVPILGGLARLSSLWTGEPSGDAARFAEVSIPLTAHIVFASLFSVLGAFQFNADLRRRSPKTHRVLGRLAALAGLAAAVTGVVLTVISDIPTAQQGLLLYGVRIAVGLGMVAAIVKGVSAILTGRVAEHEAWMLRAYALGQGAGTQVVLFLPLMLVLGHEVTGLPRDVLMTAAWLINIAVAERLIGKQTTPHTRVSAQRA